LVHAPAHVADRVGALVHASLDEASSRWFKSAGTGAAVRFVADVSVVVSWADAKG